MDQERLKELFSYDSLTGVFLWRGGQKKTVAGSVAGTVDKDGYIIICADRKNYRAHRLAWLWINGVWPSLQIDHIDCNPSHNREKRGYTFDKRRKAFVAQIRIDGKHIHLGQFKTSSEAAAAYNQAAQQFHGEFARAA